MLDLRPLVDDLERCSSKWVPEITEGYDTQNDTLDLTLSRRCAASFGGSPMKA